MASEIALETLDKHQRKLLDEVLTVTPKATFVRTQQPFGSSSSQQQQQSSGSMSLPFPPFSFFKQGSRPRTVRIPMAIASCIAGQHLNDSDSDVRHASLPPSTAFRGTLLEKQTSVIEEATRLLDSSRTCLLGLHTGFGKTILGAYLACRLGLMTLVIYPMTTLGPQWKSTFDEFTNLESVVVNERGDLSKPVPRKRNAKRPREQAAESSSAAPASGAKDESIPQVILCLNQRVKKIPKSVLDQIELVLLDEAHCLCTPSNVDALLSCTPKYLVALTATWNRSDGLHYMLELLTGTSDDFIIRKSERPFHVFKLHTRIAPEIRFTPRGVDWSYVVETLAANERRNQLVIDIARTAECKTLVLTERVPHAQTLHQLFLRAGFRTDFLAGRKSTYSDSKVLIGTVSKIGTGFDERAACADFGGERISLLILLLSTKSRTRIEQSVGRVFRSEFPRVVHFVDDHKICEKHWRVAKSWYLSRNGEIVTCEARDLVEHSAVLPNESLGRTADDDKVDSADESGEEDDEDEEQQEDEDDGAEEETV